MRFAGGGHPGAGHRLWKPPSPEAGDHGRRRCRGARGRRGWAERDGGRRLRGSDDGGPPDIVPPVDPAVSRRWSWHLCGKLASAGPDTAAVFAPDGTTIVRGQDGTIRVYDDRGTRRLGPNLSADSVISAPDGTPLIVRAEGPSVFFRSARRRRSSSSRFRPAPAAARRTGFRGPGTTSWRTAPTTALAPPASGASPMAASSPASRRMRPRRRFAVSRWSRCKLARTSRSTSSHATSPETRPAG